MENERIVKTLGQYVVEKSQHPDLYELWNIESGWHFIQYFFDLNLAEDLIKEDKKWKKYKKKLTRSIHDYDLPKPIKDPDGEDVI